MDTALKAQIEARQWFYEFNLPDGSTTRSYLPADAQAVHDTRWQMAKGILSPLTGTSKDLTALDLASHQGWFSLKLCEIGCSTVTGLEPRQQHVDDAELMKRAFGVEQLRFVNSDIQSIDQAGIEPADIVLMLGLLYHLENPVGAIRTAFKYCKSVCLIETQVGPHLSGMLDWGSYQFVRPIMGNFTVIDETDETHANEASTEGICLAPSADTLLWIMTKVGFKDVSLIQPDENAYEQHQHRKRVMAVGWV